jgi:hypothetical protein
VGVAVAYEQTALVYPQAKTVTGQNERTVFALAGASPSF